MLANKLRCICNAADDIGSSHESCSIGKKIRQLLELRNFTQTHLAKELGMSAGGYSKIERDETEVSVQKLTQIAKVLNTDIATILSFDSKQIFNQLHNKTANGFVQSQHNQNIIADHGLENYFLKLKTDIDLIKTEITDLRKNTK